MSTQPDVAEAQYLAFERQSELKHEFIDGEVYAMSGASRNHNLIVGSTLAALYGQLRGRPCETYPSDMKIRTPSTRSHASLELPSVGCELNLAEIYERVRFDGD